MSTRPPQPYYRAIPFWRGRWLVVHAVPGVTYLDASDLDCPDQASAERAAARLNAQRARQFAHQPKQQQQPA